MPLSHDQFFLSGINSYDAIFSNRLVLFACQLSFV